ncbi:MAG: DNA primase [Rhodospirillaceae bacterium]
MAFSDQFLDELRARVGIADVVGRRVKLTRKGREHSGLCPFHKEKTPSFTVNEEKGFYHCFGCQAHGSVFDFVMETEGLTFPEAVEKLAADAGMQVPRDSPEERERQKKRQTLLDVVEMAANLYERALRMPEGRIGLEYLKRRGLSDATIKRFRLGFAPDGRGWLKAALAREGVDETLMLGAGLVIKPDDDRGGPPRASYDRFRGRVMFPIADRRGRIIAFGGRIIADGEPKYLNSPETPLFQKGTTLYGLNLAGAAARQSDQLIVTEGYMDVITLAQAGFEGAVAPLGTALTEEQIQLLWKVVREPILCFDGDAAGQRAAAKAAERALPFLKPGYGLRFAVLPEGQDPDDLVNSGGAEAMRALIEAAPALSEMIWRIETGGRIPAAAEARAALEAKLKEHSRRIQDPTVRAHFSRLFGERLWPGGTASSRPGRDDGWRANRRRGGQEAGSNVYVPSAEANKPVNADELRRMALLVALVNHPDLFDEMSEGLGTITFSDTELDNLRQQVLNTLADAPDLDSANLVAHLNQSGFVGIMDRVLSSDDSGHFFFARPNAKRDLVLSGWKESWRIIRNKDLAREIEEAKRISKENPSEEASRLVQRLTQHKLELATDDDDALAGV